MTSVALVVLELPTGLISDFLGRKLALVTGATVKFLGCLIIAISSNVSLLALAYALIGIGVSFYSGTYIAVAYEAQRLPGEPRSRQGAIAQMSILAGLATFTSTILGGLIASWSLDLVGWVNAAGAFLAVVMFAAYRIPEAPGRVDEESKSPAPGRLQLAFAGVWQLSRPGQGTAIGTAIIMIVALFMPIIVVPAFQGVWRQMDVGLEVAAIATAVAGLLGAGAGYLVKRTASVVSPAIFGLVVFFLLQATVMTGSLDFIAATFVSIAFVKVLEAYVTIVGTVIVNDAVGDRFRATINSAISLRISP